MLERRLVNYPVSTVGTILAPNRNQIAASSIITEGLVLHLDSNNPYSYPSSGTVWTDISGKANDGTILGTPTFSMDRGGVFSFDGVDDEVNCGRGKHLIISDNVTCVAVVKWPTGYGGNVWQSLITKRTPWNATTGRGDFVLNWNPSHQTTGSLLMSYWPTAGTERTHRTVLTTNFEENVWHHVTAVWSKSGTDTVQTLYKNGLQLTTGTTAGNVPGNDDLDLRICNLDDSYAGNDEYGECSLAVVSIYNRALTEIEIMQNFQAIRGRFGI